MDLISEREPISTWALQQTKGLRLRRQIGYRIARLTPLGRLGKMVQPALGHFQRECRERLMQFLRESIGQVHQHRVQQPGGPHLHLDPVTAPGCKEASPRSRLTA